MSFSRRFLAYGLALGAIIRLITLSWPGTVDVEIWKVWSFAASYNATGAYGVGGAPPERRLLVWRRATAVVDYPPIALYKMGLVGRAYRLVNPRYEDSSTLYAFVKLPGLIAEAAAMVWLLVIGRRRFGPDMAAWTALAFWLNPAVILDGPILGYLDAQMAVPAVVALAVAYAGPAWLAGALAAVAVLTKAQPIFLMPVLAAVLLRSTPAGLGRFGRAAAGAAVVAGAVLLPFVARGAWANLVQAIGRLAKQDMLSGNAANVWWIFTWVLRVLDVAGEWGWRRALTQEVRILAIGSRDCPRVSQSTSGWPGAGGRRDWLGRVAKPAEHPVVECCGALRLVRVRVCAADDAGSRKPSLSRGSILRIGGRIGPSVSPNTLGGVGNCDHKSSAVLWPRPRPAPRSRTHLDRD